MKILRTPEECFDNLPDYPFAPNYLTINDIYDNTEIRIHYVDEGPRDGKIVLLMHGEPSWSFLYRKMISPFVKAGYRVIAPDLPGFGKSDKPADRTDYTYARHVAWMQNWLDGIDLQNIILFCQDWGGLLGLRLVAANPERFANVITSNTFLPTGDQPAGEAFLKWQTFSQEVPVFPTGKIIQGATTTDLSDDVIAAYDAPYPDETYKSGARQFPLLVPITPDNPESEANREAWQTLSEYEKPWLCLFGDSDPITKGGDKVFRKLIPGCADQPHTLIEGGGHFIQEDRGEELAENILNWL